MAEVGFGFVSELALAFALPYVRDSIQSVISPFTQTNRSK